MSIAVENVVFCTMSSLQSTLYKHILSSNLVESCFRRSTRFSPHLICIAALKKLCNSPSFIFEAAKSHADLSTLQTGCEEEKRGCSPSCMDEVGLRSTVGRVLIASTRSIANCEFFITPHLIDSQE